MQWWNCEMSIEVVLWFQNFHLSIDFGQVLRRNCDCIFGCLMYAS